MRNILIIGGYGHVGQKIARRLSATPGTRVTLAGRDADRARVVAARTGSDAVRLDLNDPAGWAGPIAAADTVICCIDTPDAGLARATLAQGGRYVDISATDAVLRRIEPLDDLARASDGLAVLSVGLAPGLSNLLARAALERCPEATRLRIGVLLGLGDAHGPAAIDWTLGALSPLTGAEITPMRFGPGRRRLPTIPFDFADQHALMRRGFPPVETRLALGSPLISGASLRLLSRLAQHAGARRLLARVMPWLRIGSDRTTVLAEAFAPGRPDTPACRLQLDGRREAEITALVASEVALRLPGLEARGVRHMDELWSIEAFLAPLAEAGMTPGGLLPRTGAPDPGRA